MYVQPIKKSATAGRLHLQSTRSALMSESIVLVPQLSVCGPLDGAGPRREGWDVGWGKEVAGYERCGWCYTLLGRVMLANRRLCQGSELCAITRQCFSVNCPGQGRGLY